MSLLKIRISLLALGSAIAAFFRPNLNQQLEDQKRATAHWCSIARHYQDLNARKPDDYSGQVRALEYKIEDLKARHSSRFQEANNRGRDEWNKARFYQQAFTALVESIWGSPADPSKTIKDVMDYIADLKSKTP